MLLPSSGEPIVTPTLDIVLGVYYLTSIRPAMKGEGMVFGSFEEAKLAYELGVVDFRAEINVRDAKNGGGMITTSVGRIIFNEVLPEQLGFYNEVIDKTGLKNVVTGCSKILSDEEMAVVLDNLKKLGFDYATKSGTTVAMNDIQVPSAKPALIAEAEEKTAILENQYSSGIITEDERYSGVVQAWTDTTNKIADAISDSLDHYGGIYMMANSGAKGNISQIRQMAGLRGLMTNPSGRIIDFPIKASFREGLSVLEYFISTHGARKGLTDTALRTSESGHLTRRLIDASHDVIVLEEDCGTIDGIWIFEPEDKKLLPSFSERMIGRLAATRVVHPETGEVIVERNEEIDEAKAQEIINAGIEKVHARSPLTCQSRRGVCQACYGRDLARGEIVNMNTAVGIIAAQSIGEPGTQLTLQTFHTGGVVGLDITSGLPRVEELFEARTPKVPAILADISGVAEVIIGDDGDKIEVTSTEIFRDEYTLPEGWKAVVKKGQYVDVGTVLAQPQGTKKSSGGGKSKEVSVADGEQAIIAGVTGQVEIDDGQITVVYEEQDKREYMIPAAIPVRIQTGDTVRAGQQLTDGSVNPQEMLHILGRDAVQQYLVDEVQRVYRSQGVNISDKHIEIIVHQMLNKVRVDSAGDTELIPGELIDRFQYEDINSEVLAEGGEPTTAHTVLLGITRASLSTNSWLAAASFQETTRVLTEAAVRGATDRLVGLKENVIIGRLIPARSPVSEEMLRLMTSGKSEWEEEQEESILAIRADEANEAELAI